MTAVNALVTPFLPVVERPRPIAATGGGAPPPVIPSPSGDRPPAKDAESGNGHSGRAIAASLLVHGVVAGVILALTAATEPPNLESDAVFAVTIVEDPAGVPNPLGPSPPEAMTRAITESVAEDMAEAPTAAGAVVPIVPPEAVDPARDAPANGESATPTPPEPDVPPSPSRGPSTTVEETRSETAESANHAKAEHVEIEHADVEPSRPVPAPQTPAAKPPPPDVARTSGSAPVKPEIRAEPVRREPARRESARANGGRTGETGRNVPSSAAPGPSTAEAPRAIHQPRPRYPMSARRRGLEGRVVLRVGVSRDGIVERTEVLESSGVAALDAAARSAVEEWRFAPARDAGGPTRGTVDVPIRFRLDDG